MERFQISEIFPAVQMCTQIPFFEIWNPHYVLGVCSFFLFNTHTQKFSNIPPKINGISYRLLWDSIQ